MRIKQIDNTHFGITTKAPIKNSYATNCYNEIREGAYKDYTFESFNSYVNGKHNSTLIVLKESGNWIKSKLTYFLGEKKRTIWYYASGQKL